jgi:hypothetical protein
MSGFLKISRWGWGSALLYCIEGERRKGIIASSRARKYRVPGSHQLSTPHFPTPVDNPTIALAQAFTPTPILPTACKPYEYGLREEGQLFGIAISNMTEVVNACFEMMNLKVSYATRPCTFVVRCQC